MTDMVSLWARQFVPTVQRRTSEGKGKSTPVQQVKFRIGFKILLHRFKAISDFGAASANMADGRMPNKHGRG